MEPKIVQMDTITVVGLHTLNSTYYNMIPKLWQRFMTREGEVKDVSKSNVGLGVSFGMEEIKAEEKKSEGKEFQFFHIVGSVLH